MEKFLRENPFEVSPWQHYVGYKLLDRPLVVYGMLNAYFKLPFTSILARSIDEQCYLVAHMPGSVQDTCLRNPPWFKRLLLSIREFTDKFGEDAFVLLCATPQEVVVARQHGLKAVYSNHNAMISEAVYDIRETERIYQCVYNAQLSPFKRHELAAKCERLALVYGLWGDRLNFFNRVKGLLPNAAYINGEIATAEDALRYLGPEEVNAVYNQAEVGLCLSATEGAMYSSFEYLLAGLPVVSTPALGGRDKLFPPDFTSIVEPTADLIAETVRFTSAAGFDRRDIRAAALDLRKPHRDRYVQAVLELPGLTDADLAVIRQRLDAQFTQTSHGVQTFVPAVVQGW